MLASAAVTAGIGLAACHADRSTRIPVTLKVATWNLRLNTPADGENAWPHRKAGVRGLILRHGFDVLATQEGLADQIDELDTLPGYVRSGVGRDDGGRGGEFVAIYHRSSRLAATASGHFWLSETPGRPSIGWDGRCCRRLAAWVRLNDRRSGREFLVLSAHFDHEGAIARRESARLLLQRMPQLAGTLPVLCLGDFNALPQSEPHRLLTTVLRDAHDATRQPPVGPTGTFNGFSDGPLLDRIDHILVSRDWQVERYAAIAERDNGRWPSDHLPVMAELQLV